MDELPATLERLANKLGVTVETLWPHLVALTKYEALLNMLRGFLGSAFCLLIIILGLHFGKSRIQKIYKNDPIDVLGVVLGVMVLAICSVGAFDSALRAIPQYLEPAGAALKNILENLK